MNVRRKISSPRQRQAGVAAIEFALLSLLFFTVVFGTFEVIRLLYVYNTLQEVTRRAAEGASQVYPNDTTALARVKQDAVLRDSPGALALAPPVTDAHVRIDYLALTRDPSGELHMEPIPKGAWEHCTAQNRELCMADPNAPTCIRFIRARICNPDITDTCEPVQSQMMVPLVDLRVRLHRATTITPAETLGYKFGAAPCPRTEG